VLAIHSDWSILLLSNSCILGRSDHQSCEFLHLVWGGRSKRASALSDELRYWRQIASDCYPSVTAGLGARLQLLYARSRNTKSFA